MKAYWLLPLAIQASCMKSERDPGIWNLVKASCVYIRNNKKLEVSWHVSTEMCKETWKKPSRKRKDMASFQETCRVYKLAMSVRFLRCFRYVSFSRN